MGLGLERGFRRCRREAKEEEFKGGGKRDFVEAGYKGRGSPR